MKIREPGVFSIKDPTKFARSLEDSYRNLGKLGYTKKPLTKIEFVDCVVDMLHMFLRISDLLQNLLFEAIQLKDDAKKDNADFSDKPRLNKFLNFCKYDCKISKPYYISDDKIVLRSLNGGEKMRLFTQINLSVLLNDLPKIETVDKIWRDFLTIFISVRDNLFPNDSNKINTINRVTFEWLVLF